MSSFISKIALSSLLLFSGVAAAEGNTNVCGNTPSCVMDLQAVAGAIDPSTDSYISTLAAASAKRMDEAMDAGIAATGHGPYHGSNNMLPAPPGTKTTDCTEYVVEILRQSFAAAGQSAMFDKIMGIAKQKSGSTGFKGIELLKALQGELGWTGIYFNPDVAHPGDGDDEHPYTAYLARAKGSYYGVEVDPSKSILDYDPSLEYTGRGYVSRGTELNEQSIEAINDIEFGIIAARGGRHMAVIVDGDVYEVHWSSPSTSDGLITAKPLEDWAWMSGVILRPPTGETNSAPANPPAE